jgi:hypothetical protein
MKKLLGFILGALMLVTPAWAGNTTSNGYFYLPSLGAGGAAERTTWYNSLVATDAIIKGIVDFKTDIEVPVGIIVGDGAGGWTAITDNHTSWDAGGTAAAKIGTLTATKWCLANGTGTAIDCTSDTPGAGAGIVTAVGDCAGGACFDGTSDGGTYILFYDAQGTGQIINGNLTAARVWTMPDATGTVALTTSNVATATTAAALTANGANCASGLVAAGVDAAGASEGCITPLVQANIDTSNELRAILTDETGTGAAVFATAPTFSGTVTATAFAGDGSALTGLATSFTTSAGLAALMNDETGTGLSVFGTSPSFKTKINMESLASPSIAAAGDLAFDNNIWASGHGSLVMYDGTSSTTMVAVTGGCTNGYIPKYNTAGTFTCQTDSGGTTTIAQYQIAYGSTTDTVGGDTGLTFNPTTNVVTADGFDATQAATGGYVKLYEGTGGGTNYRTFKVADTLTGDATITLDGTNGTTITLPATSGTVALDSKAITKCINIDPAAATTNWIFGRAETAWTITGFDGIADGSTSVILTPRECDADGANCADIEAAITVGTTNTTEAGGSIDNASIDAGDWVRFTRGTVSGSPTQVVGCLTYTQP